MPSNEQRRQAAKRKLERRLARQAERARKRKRLAIAGSALGVVVVVAAGIGIYYLTRGDDEQAAAAGPDTSQSETPQAPPPPEPQAKPATVGCAYRDSGAPAAKPVQKPKEADVSSTEKHTVAVQTNQGPIGITLNAGESPCTVNSFVSLVNQGYYNGTPCHRLSTKGLKMLQCGDPTGEGKGGPGYVFDNEYPTDQFDQQELAINPSPVRYERGVVAMANGGPGTNGSQFFLVYGDSQLAPGYTIFGTIDEAGLQTLDKIAAAGDDGSMEPRPGGGKPNLPVTFESVTVA
ncbi:peptidylprolyl isomerase [Nocardia wallacei]|uniref:Peptidyl-prolyl cis-trans isomerase n=1 Tax=Nocardia wallacei TaxID=480035 RepID=A0A7G1KLV0_9NOCA|nr:peptidylprolyl isomerase [Nocardia wallacei]BCK55203.1 peptidyl-prolyl cis-trans isomerase [Nocardia wallacei]